MKKIMWLALFQGIAPRSTLALIALAASDDQESRIALV